MTPEQSRIIGQFRDRTLASGYHVLNEEPLGVGGFGAALRATYERTGSIFVVKLDTRLKDKENFLGEAQTISHLRHPHIIAYYWHGFEKIPHAKNPGEFEEYPYFVIAYANEGSLKDLMKRKGLQPSEQSVRYLIDAADALDYAHKGNVLHRDIKPANILCNNGNILVADFGIATEAHSLSSNILQLPGCTGYLGHPFQKSPSRRRKITSHCLQTEAGWCTIRSRHQHPHARTTILLGDGETSYMAGMVTRLRRLKNGC